MAELATFGKALLTNKLNTTRNANCLNRCLPKCPGSNCPQLRVSTETNDTEQYIAKVYQARRIIQAGGKVTEVMTATGFSEEESQMIFDEEISMQ